MKLATGLKTTVRNLDDELIVRFFNYPTNAWKIDRLRTNHFLYREQISALYAELGGKIRSFQYQVGNRLEHTDLRTRQIAPEEKFNPVYLSYFPSVHILRKFLKNQQVQLAYARRINRPTVSQLNPVTDYTDTLFIWKGNPNLAPEYINSFEAGYSKTWKKASFNSTAFFRRSTNLITGIITIQGQNGIHVNTPQNIKGAESYGIELISSYKVSDKVSFSGSANIFKRNVNAGNINGDFINSSLSWNGRLSSNIRLGKGTEMQFNSNYRSGTVVAQAKNDPIYTVDGNLRLEVLKKQGSINLSVSDIFKTFRYSGLSYGDNFNDSVLSTYDSRVFSLNMTYKFGKIITAHEGIRRRDPNNTGRQYEDIYD
jgi:outer membrane receptor protein involved in Fe transport